ncbi:hypothetical protein ABPG74_005311 [Tetrahymena malaccensis]
MRYPSYLSHNLINYLIVYYQIQIKINKQQFIVPELPLLSLANQNYMQQPNVCCYYYNQRVKPIITFPFQCKYVVIINKNKKTLKEQNVFKNYLKNKIHQAYNSEEISQINKQIIENQKNQLNFYFQIQLIFYGDQSKLLDLFKINLTIKKKQTKFK